MKRSKVVVDAFTYLPQAINYFPIDTANNFIPDWFKRVPKDVPGRRYAENQPEFNGNTIRRCAGFIEYYSKNFLVIPLWTDIRIELAPDGYKYTCADRITDIVYHEKQMRGDEYLPEYEHLKILSPWSIYEKSGINFHFSRPFYNSTKPDEFLFPSGILNFKYQHASEMNLMIKKPSHKKIVDLEAGQPMVHLAPMTEKEVEIRTHLQSKEEWVGKRNWIFAFNNNYYKAKKIQQKGESKCPFGFGKNK